MFLWEPPVRGSDVLDAFACQQAHTRGTAKRAGAVVSLEPDAAGRNLVSDVGHKGHGVHVQICQGHRVSAHVRKRTRYPTVACIDAALP